MPINYIVALAKETGKSVREIEKLWDKAKQITKDTFGTPEKNFRDREYSYVVGVVKNMLGKGKNEKTLAMEFLKSKKSANEFLENVVSGEFDIGNVIPPDEEEEEFEFGDEENINTGEGVGNYPLIVTKEKCGKDHSEEEEIEEKASNETSNCPECGNKYPVATGYCVSCKKKVSEPK